MGLVTPTPGLWLTLQVSVTRVDPFTLTALADSGWYEVNMNAAQDLVWGKGESLVV